jgi:hypothetical protein
VAVGIGFGKPYSVAYASFVSLGCLFICAAAFQGMYEWLERFLYLLGMVVVSIAYFLNGFMYREETRLN